LSGRVLYSSPFVPPEWIEAHGLTAVRVLNLPTGIAAGAGVCPIAAGFAQAAGETSDAIVVTTTCDQMRRASESIDGAERVFLLNVPALWANPASKQFYRQELLRLGQFLVGRGGQSPDRDALIPIMLEHDAGRASLRICPPVPPGTARIALVGGPLRLGDHWFVRLLENRGASVALDATETGQRTLPLPLDPDRLHDDPLGELVHAYFDGIPDVFRRPLSMLHEYISAAVDRRGIQAIVLIRGIWCDLWHAQLSWLRQLGRPVAEVDLGGSADGAACDAARIVTRIEAMLEAIR
jgi:benzoyl-CoA reductase/2-hydroxyglutaryl-CoA dehydratase subunit BcrC/BadD/HgdB